MPADQPADRPAGQPAGQPSDPYTVRKVGERWLVVRQVPGTDHHTAVADCLTEQAAQGVADEFNGARRRYEESRHV